MPIPNDIDTVTVKMLFADFEGTPDTRYCEFIPETENNPITSVHYHTQLLPSTITVPLDNSGYAEHTLVPTDDVDTFPTGWTYRFRNPYDIAKNRPGRRIAVPVALAGASVWVDTLGDAMTVLQMPGVLRTVLLGLPGGVAQLDPNGFIPLQQIPINTNFFVGRQELTQTILPEFQATFSYADADAFTQAQQAIADLQQRVAVLEANQGNGGGTDPGGGDDPNNPATMAGTFENAKF